MARATFACNKDIYGIGLGAVDINFEEMPQKQADLFATDSVPPSRTIMQVYKLLAATGQQEAKRARGLILLFSGKRACSSLTLRWQEGSSCYVPRLRRFLAGASECHQAPHQC